MTETWTGGTMLTGVSGHFSATHRSPEGNLHGHTWHVTAWFRNTCRSDARCFQVALDTLLKRLDHCELPDDLAWGEDIARQIAVLGGCDQVEVSRPAERIYARWTWDAPNHRPVGHPNPSAPATDGADTGKGEL